MLNGTSQETGLTKLFCPSSVQNLQDDLPTLCMGINTRLGTPSEVVLGTNVYFDRFSIRILDCRIIAFYPHILNKLCFEGSADNL